VQTTPINLVIKAPVKLLNNEDIYEKYSFSHLNLHYLSAKVVGLSTLLGGGGGGGGWV
jgi:hypothetical protein